MFGKGGTSDEIEGAAPMEMMIQLVDDQPASGRHKPNHLMTGHCAIVCPLSTIWGGN